MKTQRFYIQGMTCTACSTGIERSLKRKNFILDIQVNLLSKSAKVTYDENKVTLDEIFALIAKLGYQANIDDCISQNLSLIEKFDKKFLPRQIKLPLGIIFTLATLYLSMFGMFFPSFVPNIFLDPKINGVLQLFFTLIVMHIGRGFYIRGIGTLVHGSPNMDTLIAIGTSSAFFYSFYLLVKIFMDSPIDGFYFESVCVILTFVLIGKAIENKSKLKATDSIKRLISHTSKSALKIQNNQEICIDIDRIRIGDILKVLPGSHIPTDGIILENEVSVDESMLSGEVFPVLKHSGDEVYSGTINTNKAFLMRTTKSAKNSTLNQIIHLIQNAQESKAPIARIADKVSAIFVPIVILIAILAGIFWWVYQGDFGWGLEIFVGVLVISCPCALGLATPMSIMIGGGRAAYGGIFFKNAKSLENTRKVSTIVFDKTGTLSIGKPLVQEVVIFDTTKTTEEIIELASGVELGSEHPIAKSIILYAKERHIVPKIAKDFDAKAGYGIRANIDGKIIKLGNEENFCLSKPLSALKQDGIVVLVGEEGQKDDKVFGALILKDELKPNTKEYIAVLKEMGIKTILLSGDNLSNVQAAANELQIDEFIAQAKPQDKLEKIKSLKNRHEIVMMVGDGINDAPALALADVSLVMSKGSDVSIHTADIIAFNNDIKSVINAISLSEATIKNIKENLFWAFCYNVIFIPLACGVAYGAGILLNPMIASLAMSLSSLSVVVNAQRLRKFKFKD
ncbi:heavy metal translocating P-type ATPase [Helicobacter sp. 11S03491-1]|uniref:heavy metal translocating P-type ATPase n=1 Tax=Helicobacter sp. 11S03491-1 TaxID=1476196 RepID=UPI000BA51E68|nr:heavy metal translocating P-type ATPase [Helicobacter sp. 11S03491-1]PAF43312.1 copper-transporting ATPase [Helicobacter sp. 11S03491-1]